MTPLQPVCGPTSVFQGLPKKEAYSWWSPSLPDQFPGTELDRTMEGGKIARLGRVVSIRSPLPGELVRLLIELEGLQHPPDFQVLPYLVDAEVTLYVTRPGMLVQPCGNGPRLAPTLVDAGVKLGRDLTDGEAVDPSVLPELAGLSVAWD
jgi:hypothetical protein